MGEKLVGRFILDVNKAVYGLGVFKNSVGVACKIKAPIIGMYAIKGGNVPLS